MKSSEVIDLLNELEKCYPVDQWTIESIHVWPFIRMQIVANIFVEYLKTSTKQHELKGVFTHPRSFNGILQRAVNITRFSKAYLTDYSHNSRASKKVYAVFMSDGFARTFIKNAWYSNYYDPLISYFKQNNMGYLHLEFKHNYLIPRYSQSIFIQPYFDYLTIKNMLFPRCRYFKKETLPQFEDLTVFLKSKNLNISIPSLDQIGDRVSRILMISSYYERLFEKVKPKIGFFVSYYNDYGMAFNLACRRRGIPSVDIQHGFQGELNPAYGRWDKIPTSGYELLPSIFMVWGKREETAILDWCKDVYSWHRPIVGGNLWLTLWREGRLDAINYYDQKISSIKNKYPDPINVFFTLQAGFSEYEIMKSMLETIRNTQNKWLWWLRLPSTMLNQKDNIKKLFRDNGINKFELDSASNLPLYALLRHVDVHVTHCSSTVIEAESFGVPSVLVNEYALELFPEQILSGVAVSAHTPNDIELAVKQQFNKKEYFRKKQLDNSDSTIDIKNLLEEMTTIGKYI